MSTALFTTISHPQSPAAESKHVTEPARHRDRGLREVDRLNSAVVVLGLQLAVEAGERPAVHHDSSRAEHKAGDAMSRGG